MMASVKSESLQFDDEIRIDGGESSTIEAAIYSYKDDQLTVTFRSGAMYAYFNITPKVFKEFSHAESLGSYFSANIKDMYEFEKLSD